MNPLITITPRYICLNAEARELLGHGVDFKYQGEGVWIVRPDGKLSVDRKGQICAVDTKVLITSTTGATMFKLTKTGYDYRMVPGIIKWKEQR